MGFQNQASFCELVRQWDKIILSLKNCLHKQRTFPAYNLSCNRIYMISPKDYRGIKGKRSISQGKSIFSKPEMTYICTGSRPLGYENSFTSKAPEFSFGCLCVHDSSKTLRKEYGQSNSNKIRRNKTLKTQA